MPLSYFSMKDKKSSRLSFANRLFSRIRKYFEKPLHPRTIYLNSSCDDRKSYPTNYVKNQKYSVFLFLPMVLFEQASSLLTFSLSISLIFCFSPLFCFNWFLKWIPVRFFQLPLLYFSPSQWLFWENAMMNSKDSRETSKSIHRFMRDWERMVVWSKSRAAVSKLEISLL